MDTFREWNVVPADRPPGGHAWEKQAMGWTEERMELLRSMWLEGRPAGEIAKALGDVSRNAVMGKVNRMGLMGSGEHNSRMSSVPVGCCRPTPVKPVEDVIVVSCGTIARAWSAHNDPTSIGWRLAYSLVEDLTGHAYDPLIEGHRASLVGISTILSHGDPRKVLVPRMTEPFVLGMMRRLAEKGFVVGGKTPERWRDEETGDATFFDDMLVAEEVADRKRIVSRAAPQVSRAAAVPA
jgi:hypothetical protein